MLDEIERKKKDLSEKKIVVLRIELNLIFFDTAIRRPFRKNLALAWSKFPQKPGSKKPKKAQTETTPKADANPFAKKSSTQNFKAATEISKEVEMLEKRLEATESYVLGFIREIESNLGRI